MDKEVRVGKDFMFSTIIAFIVGLFLMMSLGVTNVEAAERSSLDEHFTESDVYNKGFYRPYIDYKATLRVKDLPKDKELVDAQIMFYVGKNRSGWKKINIGNKKNIPIETKIVEPGDFLNERSIARVWLKYADGHVEEYDGSKWFTLSSKEVKHIREHPKGVEDSNAVIPSEYEFVPSWGDKTTAKITTKGTDTFHKTGGNRMGYHGKLESSVRGTTVYYNDVGTYKGKSIGLEAEIVDYEVDHNWSVKGRRLTYGHGGRILIETAGYEWSEHEWRFIDESTGRPIKVTGYFTFVDMDGLQSMLMSHETMRGVDKIYVTENSTVKIAQDREGYGEHLHTPFVGNIQEEDPNGWATLTFKDLDRIKFRWDWGTSNHTGGGFTAYVGDTVAKIETHEPEQYILGRNNSLESRYVRTNPPQPTLTYVTDHTIKNKGGGSVDSYQISQDIPSDLEVTGKVVKNTSGTDISDKFNIKREGNKVVAKAKSNSISSLRGNKVRLEVATRVKDLESKLDENGEGELRYIVEGEVKEGSTTKNAGIATGVLIYDKDLTTEEGVPYTVEYRDVVTGKELVESKEGMLAEGDTVRETPITIPEYVYTTDYEVNGRTGTGTSVELENSGDVDSYNLVFYYRERIPVEEDPEPEDQVGGTYTGRHVNSETGKRLVENDRGYLSPGQSYTLRSKNNIYGHRYTGRLYYKGVGERFSTSQTVRKLELTESEIISGVTSPRDKHEVWFYYDYINIPYEVEYRNAKTGTKIHPSNAGEVNVDNPYIARPVDVEGYNYTGRYDFNRVSTRGYATLVQYEEGRSRHKIVYYYELEDPDNTHKDFDEYDSMEAYTNVGLVTKRDEPSDAIVGHNKKEFGEDVLVTKVNANTTAVLDKYKAPIAIEPVELRLEVKDSTGSTSEQVRNTSGEVILNTDYVDGLRIQKAIGYGKGNSTTKLNIVGRNGYLDMEDGVIKSVDQARKEALGASGSTIDTDSEETGYYGRWLGVSQDVIDLEGWTPTNSLSANVEHEMTDAALDKVTTTIDYKVHNILKHNYITKTITVYNSESGGYDIIEYYEYKDTDILEGFYSGGRLQDSGLEFETEVDISGIKVGEMLNAKGFNVNNNKLSTTKHLVAREKFTTNGTKYTGHETLSQSRGNGNYNDLVESDRDGKTGEVYLDKELDYYEEFGYMPYSVSEEDLMTQQAVPVGGKITYINPYDYFVLPSAIDNSDTKRGSAIDSSSHELGETLNKSKTIDKVSRNVGSIKRNGLYTSVMPYNKTNSGFYSESVDEFDEFGIEGIGTDKDSMKQGLGSPYSPVRVDTGYTHQNLELSDGSVLEYKQPIRFDGEKSQVRLRNRVLVGRMTGYPVIIDAQEELDIEEAHSGVNRKEEFTKRYADIYEEAYEREFGYKPTKYDKALSGNGEMTWYYLPLEKENIRKNDEFATRLVVNGIGTSQFNLVEDHSYGFEKFLYGRGEDVIYSGERESFESFEEESGSGQDDDKLQIIGQEKESEKTDQINGVRTRNNSEINKKLLEE